MAEVESSNVVGYQKIDLDAGYNMIGVQFNEVGGADKPVATVGQLSANMAGFNEDGDFDTEMMVWADGNYTTYGWAGTSGTDYDAGAELDNKWLDRDNLVVPNDADPLPAYGAFWVKAGSAGSILIKGEVPDGDVTVPLAAGYNMVANPLPQDVPVATFGRLAASMAGFNEDGDFATEMMVWEDGNYTTYGWAGTSGTDYDAGAELDNKWLDRDNLVVPEVTTVVRAGHAVWIKAGSAGSITFSAN